MALEYRGYARLPGPLGNPMGVLGGRIPGPLDFQKVNAPAGVATKAIGPFEMPAPTATGHALRARSVGLPLAGKSLTINDIGQGFLANCPIPAILAAMVNTASGTRRVNGLITEYAGVPVKTVFPPALRATLTKRFNGDPDYKAPAGEIASTGYFKVQLGDDIEVSDVFYAEYDDAMAGELEYMHAPGGVIWPCVIEKAYAVKVGGYDALNREDEGRIKANEFWKVLMGSDPQGFKTEDDSDLRKISSVAQHAKSVPAIAASQDDKSKLTNGIVDGHGYSILGFNRARTLADSTIELFNPWGMKIPPLKLSDFQVNFAAVLYGSPG